MPPHLIAITQKLSDPTNPGLCRARTSPAAADRQPRGAPPARRMLPAHFSPERLEEEI